VELPYLPSLFKQFSVELFGFVFKLLSCSIQWIRQHGASLDSYMLMFTITNQSIECLYTVINELEQRGARLNSDILMFTSINQSIECLCTVKMRQNKEDPGPTSQDAETPSHSGFHPPHLLYNRRGLTRNNSEVRRPEMWAQPRFLHANVY
jgi:hypothetical protein